MLHPMEYVGAVLSHAVDGEEKPIAYTSRSLDLAVAEKKYSQLAMDKEGLAILFGVKCFHQFLYGQEFVIYSDHKPLKHTFDEK